MVFASRAGGAGDNKRVEIPAPVAPRCRGGLRVGIDDAGWLLRLRSARGQVQGDGGLTRPALLADNGNGWHGSNPKMLHRTMGIAIQARTRERKAPLWGKPTLLIQERTHFPAAAWVL